LWDASFQGTQAEITELKKRVLSWELYHRSLVSDDFKSTQILVTIKSIGAQQTKGRPIDPKKEVYTDIQEALAGMDLKDIEVYQSGLPTISVLLSKNMQKDLVVLIPLVILIIVFSLYFSFKRLGGIILPLGTVLISVIWAMGLMCMLGFKLSMIATVIPVILMAVGSAYGIHVISHYYDELLEFKGDIDGERHKALIIEALKKTGVPVFLAGITTIAGFGSLAFTSILPIRDFGIFASFGVLVALAGAPIGSRRTRECARARTLPPSSS
jgi:predicted RND superfamily exporter protein